MNGGKYRTFTGSASIKVFTAFRENIEKSTAFYRRSTSVRKSVTRFAVWSVAVTGVASAALERTAGHGLGIAVLLWTLPVIMVYFVFIRFNLVFLKSPEGSPVEGLRAANILTAIRIFLVPSILVLLCRGETLWGTILYCIAACTDIADGYVARRFDQRTMLGLALDPVGDILLTAALFAFLWYRGFVPTWLFVLLIVRYAQFFIGLAAMALFGFVPKLGATAAGKVVGVVQAAGIVILLANMIVPAAVPFAAIRKYLFVVLGIAFGSVIVSQTVIGLLAVRSRNGQAVERQGS